MIVVEDRKDAARVIAKLKVMYPSFGAKMDDEWMNLTIDEWFKGLNGIEKIDVSNAIETVRRSGSEFAPSLPKFIEYCGGRPARNKALEHREEDQLDYARLWMNANDKTKYRFFIDHKFNLVPGYVRVWFINYNKQHRGWTEHESDMMIKFWAQPSWLDISDDEQENRRDRLNEMVDQHQKKILKYFLHRRSA